MIGQNNHIAENKNRKCLVGENITLFKTNNPTQVSGSQVDMQTLEKNNTNKVRC